ncbi:hypothetical protein GDO86_005239 [Hymenochirus boettgeri]|uniref:Leukotriene C4 synthase n=1 Tax=Hymenochirus boettgeri TaxID=247094 RepID=A0A8T2J5P6_9PIPI|nr:hypothetical protein GDO86_005239 [Hymenochirus boettgeri]
MLHDIALLAAVTLVGVLEQAFFALQVIASRRKYSVSPPKTTGPPEFERVFRAQINCFEYFPLFLAVLWLAGIFFHQGTASICGLLYLVARYYYFQGYSVSPKERLGPMYLSAGILWLLIGLSAIGILHELLLHYLDFKLM